MEQKHRSAQVADTSMIIMKVSRNTFVISTHSYDLGQGLGFIVCIIHLGVSREYTQVAQVT